MTSREDEDPRTQTGCPQARELKAHLCISRIRIKDIAEKLARNRNTRNDQSMDVVRINHERPPDRILTQLGHPVKVDEQAQEDMVRRRAVLEDAQEIGLEGDGGDVPRVEGEGSCGGGYGVAGCGGEGVEERWGVGGVYGCVVLLAAVG